jgi:hypothetical protein
MHHTTPAVSTTSGAVGNSRRRPLAAAALAAVVASVVGLGLASAPAMADDCPNAALRAQNNSTQLPDCRAYELVSPVFKEGFQAIPTDFTNEGRVVYQSNGNFAGNGNGSATGVGGNQYVAVRSATGWSTQALAPAGPAYDFNITQVGARSVRFSSDLRSSLWVMRRSSEPVELRDLYLRGPDDIFTRIGSEAYPLAPPFQAGDFQPRVLASDDLSHVVLSVPAAFAYPGTVATGQANPYEYLGTGHNGPPQPVSVDNAGQQIGPGCNSPVNAVSGDGRVVVFSTECASRQVWARINSTTTIAVSASECTRPPGDPGGACNGVGPTAFQGASADYSRIYLTTTQQLVNSDTDTTADLYACDIPTGTPAPVGTVNPCSALQLISGAASGADVQRVMRISDDGSHVYFVARGVLATNPDANDAVAVAGDDNLYVWQRDGGHPVGETRFVAKLDPADSDIVGVQTTPDGSYLLFGSRASLIDHGPQADTDAVQDLYRYDAASHVLTRLSTDTDGDGGNEPATDAKLRPIQSFTRDRARTTMSDDGDSVTFVTDEALAPADTNGTIDSYLWHDDRVSLISSGEPSDDNVLPDEVNGIKASISPSGRDVYFETTVQMTPNDVDTVVDIYDARVDGGFDVVSPPTCSGDPCQGGRSAPPPATNTDSTGKNDARPTTPAFTVAKLTASQLRRVASTGKVSLSVTTNAPGTLSAKATSMIAQRLGAVGSVKRAITKAGTVSLSLTLSKKARAELKSKRKLTVKIVVSQDNVAVGRTVTLKLTQPKAAGKTKKSLRSTLRTAVANGGRS